MTHRGVPAGSGGRDSTGPDWTGFGASYATAAMPKFCILCQLSLSEFDAATLRIQNGTNMLNVAGRYNKAIGAFLVALVGWLTLVANSPSDSITSSEWISAVTGVVGVITVYLLANSDPKA